jgi:hypothetical protein
LRLPLIVPSRASSSDTVLVPDANIVLSGSGASRTVTVTPASNQSGSATITLTVSDGTASSTDTFVLTVVMQKTTVTQKLSLNTGWNLVSFYVEASDMSAATVLAPISSSLLQIKNLTSSYDPSIPSFLNTLASLSVKDGYWLKVSEDVSLDVEGTVPSGASISVKSGWNLVGYPRSSRFSH